MLLLFLPLERNAAGGINSTCSGKESGREIERVCMRVCVGDTHVVLSHVARKAANNAALPVSGCSCSFCRSPIPNPPSANLQSHAQKPLCSFAHCIPVVICMQRHVRGHGVAHCPLHACGCVGVLLCAAFFCNPVQPAVSIEP